MVKTLKVMFYAAFAAVVFVTVTKQAVAMVMDDSSTASNVAPEAQQMVIYQNTNQS